MTLRSAIAERIETLSLYEKRYQARLNRAITRGDTRAEQQHRNELEKISYAKRELLLVAVYGE